MSITLESEVRPLPFGAKEKRKVITPSRKLRRKAREEASLPTPCLSVLAKLEKTDDVQWMADCGQMRPLILG